MLGVKMVTVSPENGRLVLPVIHGLYVLFNAVDGRPLLSMDARLLTARRTAATSALASTFLSREDTTTLLMIGTGALARELIPAHASVRPIKKVLIWGRDPLKAEKLASAIHMEGVVVQRCISIPKGLEEADIISCATVSATALIEGRWLRPGQHVDLVGAYRPDMRESDDDVIRRTSIFVDSRSTAPVEAGDLAMPIRDGVIMPDDVQGDLFELCKGAASGRTGLNEITLFKSVGHALEDLVAAKLVYSHVKDATS